MLASQRDPAETGGKKRDLQFLEKEAVIPGV